MEAKLKMESGVMNRMLGRCLLLLVTYVARMFSDTSERHGKSCARAVAQFTTCSTRMSCEQCPAQRGPTRVSFFAPIALEGEQTLPGSAFRVKILTPQSGKTRADFACTSCPARQTERLYGKDMLARAQQAQTEDRCKIRRPPCRNEGEGGLCGTFDAAS